MHATGGFRAGQLAPQHRRKVEPDEIVERAAGKISLHQITIDLTRVLHRLGNCGLGDRVKDDAADRCVGLDRLAQPQRLFKVPGDRFALAIGVGGEDQGVVVLQRVGDCLDVLLAVRGDLPFHVEIVVRVDRTVLGRQVANMPVGGQDSVVRPKIFVDCLGLGRGFDNNDGHMGSSLTLDELYGGGPCGSQGANVNAGDLGVASGAVCRGTGRQSPLTRARRPPAWRRTRPRSSNRVMLGAIRLRACGRSRINWSSATGAGLRRSRMSECSAAVS